ncbi:mucin-22-like [Scyliorhinus canicula]|uniref:mucin-22-like n=1 Tax=Scyliorhinus canicula TaxID=7830 RepID=UPI0018F63A1F|nr:mucin-22-like [Scyliorhinus canicula]
METLDRWKICLYLFVTVLSSSLGNSTTTIVVTMPTNATSPAFNLSTTIMGSNNFSTVASDYTLPHIGNGSTIDITTTPSLKNGTGFSYSSVNSTVSTLTDAPDVGDITDRMTNNDTSNDLQKGNETKIHVSIPSPTSGPSTISVNASVGPVMTERNGNATEVGHTVTTVSQQTLTPGKMDSSASNSPHETTVEPTLTTSAGQKVSKDSANATASTQSPVSETMPIRPTSQNSKTIPTTVTSSGSGVTSSITVALPTIHTRATTTVKAAATSSTTIGKVTTSFSVQHSEENSANTKEMVDGKPVSSPNGTKVDPLVIGMITIFFIIIGIVSILGFLKYRQRNNQPEFRRLHELPMDDMMEEDTPLSLYSY